MVWAKADFQGCRVAKSANPARNQTVKTAGQKNLFMKTIYNKIRAYRETPGERIFVARVRVAPATLQPSAGGLVNPMAAASKPTCLGQRGE
jgi:hypothetical protein